MGFPSPADDFFEKKLDLNELLIKHQASTYFVRVTNSPMKSAGIMIGDLLVIDRSLDLENGSIALIAVDGEYDLRKVKKVGKGIYLVSDYGQMIKANPNDDWQVFGVVAHVIRTLLH